jgi:hypothetical protein
MSILTQSLIHGLLGLLVQQLGDDSYRKRDLAHKFLKPIAWLAAEHLEQATRHHDAEIATRAGKLYAPIREHKCEQVAFTLRPKMPWLYLADSYQQHFWIERAEKQYGAPGGAPDWPNYRVATKLYAKQLLLDGRALSEIHILLDHMQHAELDWIRRYRSQNAQRD